MNKLILALSFFILNFSSNLPVNAEQLFQSKEVNNSEVIETNEPENEIKRKSFEFGLGGVQLQIRGSYTPDVLNDNLDIFLKAGMGFIASRSAYYGLEAGTNFELGGKYFFYNKAFFKLLTGYSIPFSNNTNKAFYAGIGIGNDFMINKSWGINLGIDLGSTFEVGQNGPQGIIFLRPELNVKYAF